MESSISFYSGNRVACIETEGVSFTPVSEFIKSCAGSTTVFSESDNFGKVSSKPLTDNPDVFV